MSIIEPYQFEPQKNTNEISDEEWEDVEDLTEAIDQDDESQNMTKNRLSIDLTDWCKCGKCKIMPVSRECLCSSEVEEVQMKKLGEGMCCIIEHEAFEPVVLNKYVLWASLVSLHDRECAWLPPEDNIPNRSYRYAAYRQFSWFIYSKLGRHVRRIIPACVVSRIRSEFPEENGVYVNFSGNDEGADAISKVVAAWEYMNV